MLICGQERSGSALFANGVAWRRPVAQDESWMWEAVPAVLAGDRARATEILDRYRSVASLKCPSWVLLVTQLGAENFDSIVFLQRDIRDQACSLVEMMTGTTALNWHDPHEVWRGEHGDWCHAVAQHLGIDLSRPVRAMAEFWCRYTIASRGLRVLHYEDIVQSTHTFSQALYKVGIEVTNAEAGATLGEQAHGNAKPIRGMGRWKSDLPWDVVSELLYWQGELLSSSRGEEVP